LHKCLATAEGGVRPGAAAYWGPLGQGNGGGWGSKYP